MEEPLISRERKIEKNIGQISNFAKYLVKGSLDAIILGISILVSSINYETKKINHPSGLDLNKLIYFGIPIIVANAFSHSLINIIINETDFEAKEIRKEIQEDIKENVNFPERGYPVSMAIVYISIYIIFAMFIFLPFLMSFYYNNISRSVSLWWFVFIIIIELIIVSVVRAYLTKGNFFKSFLEFLVIAIVAAGITSLVRTLLEQGLINY